MISDTCDNNCDSCEEGCQPIASSPMASRTIDFAAQMIVEIDKNIPNDVDLENVTVSCNAERLYCICELVLAYAEAVDDVNVDELLHFAEIEASTPVVSARVTKH